MSVLTRVTVSCYTGYNREALVSDIDKARDALAENDALRCGAKFPHQFTDSSGCCVESVTRICCRGQGHAGNHSEFARGPRWEHLRNTFAAHDALAARVEALEAALLNADTPFPLDEVLRLLVNAADHLHEHHDCDTHGWEVTRGATDAAREIRARLAALTPGASRE